MGTKKRTTKGAARKTRSGARSATRGTVWTVVRKAARSLVRGVGVEFRALFELVYPRLCFFCDAPLDDESRFSDASPAPASSDAAPPKSGSSKKSRSSKKRRIAHRETRVDICSDCRRRTVVPARVFCKRCGRVARWEPLLGGRDDVLCARCRKSPPRRWFDEVRPLGFYRGLARTAILRMKRDRDGALTEAVARLYWDSRERVLRAFRPDLVVSVPAHWTRRWSRGVNAPDRIATALAKRLGVPVDLKLVRRIRATPPQSSVDWDARRLNVSGAFELRGTPRTALRDLFGKRALLVDDAFTSGATTNEISRLLKDAGVGAVCVVAIARAGLGKRRRTKN